MDYVTDDADSHSNFIVFIGREDFVEPIFFGKETGGLHE